MKPNPYLRTIRNAKGQSIKADVYDILDAYDCTRPAIAHAIKKLILPGKRRGDKSTVQDLEEAIESIRRAIQLEKGRRTK